MYKSLNQTLLLEDRSVMLVSVAHPSLSMMHHHRQASLPMSQSHNHLLHLRMIVILFTYFPTQLYNISNTFL